MVMEDDDAQRPGGSRREEGARPLQLVGADVTLLVEPGRNRVQAVDGEIRRAVLRLGRLPDSFEGRKGPEESLRWKHGNVVIPRDGEYRATQSAEERSCPVVLGTPVAMRQVTARHDELWAELLYELVERVLHLGPSLVVSARVEIGDVEEACGHEGSLGR